jgi:hypothetical protein
MLPRKPPEFQAGQPVSAAALRALAAAVRRQRVTVDPTSGLQASERPEGTTIRLASRALGCIPVQAPVGGIAALAGTTPGSATCTRYTWTGTAFALGSATLTVRNSYGSAVGAGKLVWATWWQGSWWVLTEAC